MPRIPAAQRAHPQYPQRLQHLHSVYTTLVESDWTSEQIFYLYTMDTDSISLQELSTTERNQRVTARVTGTIWILPSACRLS
jgi:hypothetical protein